MAIKLALTYPLYTRKTPSNEEPPLDFLPEGSVIEVEDVVVGKPIDGNSIWYKTVEGVYYWSGGVELYNKADKFDYKSIISNLPTNWLNTNGRTSVISIIDTGISINKLFFNGKLLSEISLVDASSANKDHGTFICGIIAGFNNCIKGIAFESKILSFRYKDENTILEKALDNLLKSLEKLEELQMESMGRQVIINISQGFNSFQTSKFPDKIQKIESLIIQLANSGALICAAAGENSQLTDGNLLFPALLPDVISVGCISEDSKTLMFSDKINIVTPLQTYKSYDTNFDVISDIGSSFSVAIISSIAALIDRQVNSTSDIKGFLNALKPFSMSPADFNFQNNSYQFSILN